VGRIMRKTRGEKKEEENIKTKEETKEKGVQ
jgi:hypothetical protein